MVEVSKDDSGSRDQHQGEELPVRDWWSGADPDLQLLVGLVNKLEFELPMRIFIPSGVLSGYLIAMPAYFSRVAGVLHGNSDDGSNPVADALAKSYDSISEARRKNIESNEPDDDVRHIHLDQAVLHGTGAEPLQVGLWRGRLSNVSGWSMGNYGDQVE
ncbi:hypothetical protein [Nocardioides sp. WS12]|uniref:hypothetical protein n=1 Tax=Nocardioides sp. WS12 TaxID=2486272 RepID=UPI0015F7DCDC|nr:hypothetical protein [Nocardioides sp. WS12]